MPPMSRLQRHLARIRSRSSSCSLTKFHKDAAFVCSTTITALTVIEQDDNLGNFRQLPLILVEKLCNATRCRRSWPNMSTPAARPLVGDRGNIMVVDDNPANLKLMENMLRAHGYEVRSFPRGRLALAAAEQEPPDLILLDINMPEMDGYEVCEKLQASPRLSTVPVVFLSALNAIEDKVKGFQSGEIDYISKPFRFEEVRARVDTHLNFRRAQRAEHDLLERTL